MSTLLVGDVFTTVYLFKLGICMLYPLKPDSFFAFNIFGNKSRTWCLVETILAYCRELQIVCLKSLYRIKMQLDGTSRSHVASL